MDDKTFISNIIKEDIKSAKRITDGISNVDYLVNDKYVVRLKKHKDRFYSYKNEAEIMHKTAHLFISERTIYLDKDGNKISDYIPNAHQFKKNDKEIVKCAELLKQLHHDKIKVKADFNTFGRYKYYRSTLDEEDFSHEQSILKKVHQIYHKYEKVICHNDMVKGNFLFTKNRSYLIDYEFAGKNIALFDLASFISENNINKKEQIKLFIEAYGMNKDCVLDLEYMIIFTNLFWYYWANERLIATKEPIYQKIKDMKKKNIQNDLKSLLIYKKH